MSSHIKLIKYLNQQNLSINEYGIIKPNFKPCYFFLGIVYIMICIMLSLKSTIYTLCLYTTSVYGYFVKFVLDLNHIFYIHLTKPYITNHYYQTTRGELICLSPQMTDFADKDVPLIPLSEEELKELEKHTGLCDLVQSQNKILALCSSINAFHIINHHSHYNKFKMVQHQNDIDIMTKKESFKINFILTDYVHSLETGEILNLSYYSHEDQQIYIENKYIMNKQYQLEILSEDVKDHVDVLPFYSLENPRPKLVFHPYHLPKTADFIMSIMIITQAIIDLL
jgi:hypothetical protein